MILCGRNLKSHFPIFGNPGSGFDCKTNQTWSLKELLELHLLFSVMVQHLRNWIDQKVDEIKRIVSNHLHPPQINTHLFVYSFQANGTNCPETRGTSGSVGYAEVVAGAQWQRICIFMRISHFTLQNWGGGRMWHKPIGRGIRFWAVAIWSLTSTTQWGPLSVELKNFCTRGVHNSHKSYPFRNSYFFAFNPCTLEFFFLVVGEDIEYTINSANFVKRFSRSHNWWEAQWMAGSVAGRSQRTVWPGLGIGCGLKFCLERILLCIPWPVGNLWEYVGLY
jgi:hypothetical protein